MTHSKLASLGIILLLLTGCSSALDYNELVAAQYPSYQPGDILVKRVLDVSQKAKCGYVSAQFFEAVQRSLKRDQTLVAAGGEVQENVEREAKLAKAKGCSGEDGNYHIVEFQFPGESSTWFMVFNEKGTLDQRGEVLVQQ
jgi:hypothetical protein